MLACACCLLLIAVLLIEAIMEQDHALRDRFRRDLCECAPGETCKRTSRWNFSLNSFHKFHFLRMNAEPHYLVERESLATEISRLTFEQAGPLG